MEQTTVSLALKPLIRDGFISVSKGANKREKALSLSSEGKDLYQQAHFPWQQVQKKLRSVLAPGQDDLLVKLSEHIVASRH